MSYIGQKIRELRKARKLTQDELATLLDVSPSAVGMYEQGRRSPNKDMLVKLCEIFSVSSDSLLGVNESSSEAVDIIREMSERIRSDSGVLLDGTPMSVEDREALLSAIEVATNIMLSKKRGKED